jgi:hypothetical protein
MPSLVILANEGVALESISRQDKEYLKLGRWKCAKSPTGAHWWLGTGPEHFKCKYCRKGRTFPVFYGPERAYNASSSFLNEVFKD